MAPLSSSSNAGTVDMNVRGTCCGLAALCVAACLVAVRRCSRSMLRESSSPTPRELMEIAVLFGAVLVMLPISWLAMSFAQLVLDDHALGMSVLAAP